MYPKLIREPTFLLLCEYLCVTLWLTFFYHKGAQSTSQRFTKEYIFKSYESFLEAGYKGF
jgi:hypothetical protein